MVLRIAYIAARCAFGLGLPIWLYVVRFGWAFGLCVWVGRFGWVLGVAGNAPTVVNMERTFFCINGQWLAMYPFCQIEIALKNEKK